jgi:hypothetical protein
MTDTFGLLLSGESAADKTCIINAIVNKYNKVLINVPMSIIKTKTDLMNILYTLYYGKDVIQYENRIYLFEDIDCDSLKDIKKKGGDHTEKGEDNTEKDKDNTEKNDDIVSNKNDLSKPKYNDMDNLSINKVLNIIDGLVEFQGRMIIITTNNPEALDADLLSSVKIDMNIHIGKLHSEDISKIYKE